MLDVGCGKLLPLAKLLYVNKMSPRSYVGVDANKFEIPEMLQGKKIPMSIWPETDFCALSSADVGVENGSWISGGESPDFLALVEKRRMDDNFDFYTALSQLRGTSRAETKQQFLEHMREEHGARFDLAGNLYDLPNVVVAFEIFEHICPEHGRRLLQHMLKVTSPDCNYFISTPCWNGDAAQNHVSETGYAALGALIEDLGFHVDGVWGTFASIRDYKDQLHEWTHYYRGNEDSPKTTNLVPLFDVLSTYYDTNVLATIFAPLFPAYSRNCLWHLTRAAGQPRKFPKLIDVPTPWTQHPDWRELNGPVEKESSVAS